MSVDSTLSANRELQDITIIVAGNPADDSAFRIYNSHLQAYLQDLCEYHPPKPIQKWSIKAPILNSARTPGALGARFGRLEAQYRILKKLAPSGCIVEVLGYDWV